MSRWTAKRGSYRRRGTSSPPFHRDYCDDTLMESVTTGEARIGDGALLLFSGCNGAGTETRGGRCQTATTVKGLCPATLQQATLMGKPFHLEPWPLTLFFSSTIQRRTVGYYVCGCYTLRLRILLERSSLGIISVLLTIMFDAVNNSNCRLQARSRTKESSRFALAH
jgi:hypothetical protein